MLTLSILRIYRKMFLTWIRFVLILSTKQNGQQISDEIAVNSKNCKRLLIYELKRKNSSNNSRHSE